MKKMISRRNFLKVAGASAAALGLAACGGSSSSTAASTASSTAASAAPAAAGKVYYLNFKPEQDQDWQDLAAEYTKETGVPVTVVTAASGQYETTLMSEMEKSEAPTLFQVNGPVGLANWKDYCLDLSDSKLYGEATTPKDVTILGGKTGTTDKAGNCLALLSQNAYGKPFISIVMGASSKDVLYQEMTSLLQNIN